MRTWKPQPNVGFWIGLVLLVIVLGGTVTVGMRVAGLLNGPPENWPIDLSLYSQIVLLLGLCLVLGALVYRMAATLTLRYQFDRNGLYIMWLGNRAVVPLDQIESVDLGVVAAHMPFRLIQGIGYYWGQGHTDDGRLLHLFATQSPRRCLAINTANAVYAISPTDHDAFVQDLEQRRNLGATKSVVPAVEPSSMFLYAFWNDRTVRTLLILAFAINLLVLAALSARYPQLGSSVHMRFNAEGQATVLQPRHQVLFLPIAAFGLSLLNTAGGLLLYRNQQLGARLLQGASVLVQVLFGVAVMTIIR